MENTGAGFSLIVILLLLAAPFIVPGLLGVQSSTIDLIRKNPVYKSPLINLWDRIFYWPFGTSFFNVVIGFIFPYAGFNCEVMNIEAGKVRAFFKDRWSVKDFNGLIDPTALAGPAKLVAYLAICSVCPEATILCHGYSSSEFRTTKGPVYLECITSLPRGSCISSVVIRDSAAKHVGEIKFYWTIGRQSPSITRFK